MNLDRYLRRISYDGDCSPSIECLNAIHRAHACSVPFENLDVQLRRPLSTDVTEAYDKIVVRGQGGWCYEQNGLLGLALQEIGFSVTRVAASHMRHENPRTSDSDHLCLLVQIDEQQFLADVGFGGSLLSPIKLRVGEHRQTPYRLGLRVLDDGYWQFWEDDGKGEFSFDFRAENGDENAMSFRCDYLQTNHSSSFVRTLTAQLRTAESRKILRGRVFTIVTANGGTRTLLDSADQLVELLEDEFDLHVPEIAAVWPKIVARHEELFGS